MTMRLVEVGVPEQLALVFAVASTSPAGQRAGDAAGCVLEPQDALKVVEWTEKQLAGELQLRQRVFALLGAAALLFGAEEGSRIVLRHMPEAVRAVEEMANEPDDGDDDSLLSAAARAEPLMLRTALERAAASDPGYSRELYMDESVLLPGFIVADRGGAAEPAELSGALVSTPHGIVFALSDAMLSEATARLIPYGLLEHGTLHFGLDELTAAALFLPDNFGEEDEAPGVDYGPSPDDDVHVHFTLRGRRRLSVRLLFAGWPAARLEVLVRRLDTMVERIAEALR
jgi:hypothetical protein